MSNRIVDLFYERMLRAAQSNSDTGSAAALPSAGIEAGGGIAEDEGIPMINDQESPNSAKEDRKKLFEAQIRLNKVQQAFNYVSKQPPGAIFEGEKPFGGRTFGELTNEFSSELEEMMDTVRILSNRGGSNERL